MDAFGLIALGLAVGTLGTLVGAGGGFVLVPVLLLVYPHESPEIITAISLAVVFANAFSGSVAYARMGRIDYKSGLLFALATIPGAILGALTTEWIPRKLFNGVFGALLVLAGLYLIVKRTVDSSEGGAHDPRFMRRRIVEKNGTLHEFSYSLRLGMGVSLFVGYLSSLLGIGGGIIHVPFLVRFLNFPVHLATATSHFILAIMALAGTIVHIANGSFSPEGVARTVYLAIGVLVGAQVGAVFSNRVKGEWIIRCLAVALAFVGIRIFLMAL